MKQPRPKNDQPAPKPTRRKGGASAADHRVAQRHHKESQAAQLSAANVEESPHMDRGDDAGEAGESLSHGRDAGDAAEPLRRGALDTQYGTKSSSKTGGPGPVSSGAATGSETSKGGDRGQSASDPGRPEDSSGTGRDTMTTSRPGSGS